MARIRTIKPEFFSHENLYDLEMETGLPLRLAFAGLWTVCDREGRFKWRPRTIKSQVLPHDDVDFSRVLDALTTRGFVVKYTSEGAQYGVVPGFSRHQIINNREAASVLPEPPKTLQNVANQEFNDACPTRAPRVPHASKEEGKGREGERKGKGREGVCTEPASVLAVLDFDPTQCKFPVFPCSGNQNTWQATNDQIDAWRDAYPGVDIDQHHRRAHIWIMSNLTKRKTSAGMPKFLNAWFAKQQDNHSIPGRGPAKTFAQQSLENTLLAVERFINE